MLRALSLPWADRAERARVRGIRPSNISLLLRPHRETRRNSPSAPTAFLLVCACRVGTAVALRPTDRHVHNPQPIVGAAAKGPGLPRPEADPWAGVRFRPRDQLAAGSRKPTLWAEAEISPEVPHYHPLSSPVASPMRHCLGRSLRARSNLLDGYTFIIPLCSPKKGKQIKNHRVHNKSPERSLTENLPVSVLLSFPLFHVFIWKLRNICHCQVTF